MVFAPLTVTAYVARIDGLAAAYLRLTEAGKPDWVTAQAEATPFGSMREATRLATKLPARLKAFGVPRRD